MAESEDKSGSNAPGGKDVSVPTDSPSAVVPEQSPVADETPSSGETGGDRPAFVVYGMPSGLGAAPANDVAVPPDGTEALSALTEDAQTVLLDLAESDYDSVLSGFDDTFVQIEGSTAAVEGETDGLGPEPTTVEFSGLEIADLISDFDDSQSVSLSDHEVALFDHYLATAEPDLGGFAPNVTIEVDDDPGSDSIC